MSKTKKHICDFCGCDTRFGEHGEGCQSVTLEKKQNFKPTGRCLELQRSIPEYIKKHGIENFRNSSDSEVRGYGNYDFDPIDMLNEQKMGLTDKLISIGKNNNTIRKIFGRIAFLYLNMTLEHKLKHLYLFSKYYGIVNKAKPIEQLSDSLVGNPKNVIKINNNHYTFSLLRYYNLYSETCKIIDFSNISSILEIGSGFGMQAEVFKKFYPNITIFLVDLPAQLSIQEKYLNRIFPNKVIRYGDNKNYENKIVLVPPEHIEKIEFDLLWNSVSFQVMDIDVAKNYLKIINQKARKFVCLHNKMESPNKDSIVKEDYVEQLSNFKLINYELSEAHMFTRRQNIFNMIFEKKL